MMEVDSIRRPDHAGKKKCALYNNTEKPKPKIKTDDEKMGMKV
jgi:hypothetical protein